MENNEEIHGDNEFTNFCMVGCAFCGIKVGSGEPEEAYFVNGEGNVRASSNAAGTQL